MPAFERGDRVRIDETKVGIVVSDFVQHEMAYWVDFNLPVPKLVPEKELQLVCTRDEYTYAEGYVAGLRAAADLVRAEARGVIQGREMMSVNEDFSCSLTSVALTKTADKIKALIGVDVAT